MKEICFLLVLLLSFCSFDYPTLGAGLSPQARDPQDHHSVKPRVDHNLYRPPEGGDCADQVFQQRHRRRRARKSSVLAEGWWWQQWQKQWQWSVGDRVGPPEQPRRFAPGGRRHGEAVLAERLRDCQRARQQGHRRQAARGSGLGRAGSRRRWSWRGRQLCQGMKSCLISNISCCLACLTRSR